jgi:hypothetical protein
MAITESDLQQAEQRMRERLEGKPRVVGARYDRRVSRVVVMRISAIVDADFSVIADGVSA